VHDDEVVKIEEVEGGEAEECGKAGFQKSLAKHQFRMSILNSQP
jgi:hypothetical protein